jgi:hypothetical protein
MATTGGRVRLVSVEERRRTLVRLHCLDGAALGAEEVTDAMVALHASDPASVFLSVLARSRDTSLGEVWTALYDRRSLLRWMAMRRTLFVLHVGDVPMVQAAVSDSVAATLQRRLVAVLERNGTSPAITGDVRRWLTRTADRVAAAVRTRGAATGTQLSADVPELRTRILTHAPSDRPQTLTTPLLTQMSAQGRIVRGDPTGTWTSRGHRWEPVEARWPEGLPHLDVEHSQRELARRWLTQFGPATSDDLQWWTGWSKRTVARVLAELHVAEVDLHGRPGMLLKHQVDTVLAKQDHPTAVLLPALDPTPMGWKHRDWFTAVDTNQIYDRAGNIGPTIWWDGEIIGVWVTRRTGEIHTALTVDRGREAHDAVTAAATQLQHRLDGATVTPAARTPLETSLARSKDQLESRSSPPFDGAR